MTTTLERCYATGHTLFVFGNGGSAATASHLAADFTKLATPPGSPRRLRALCLSDSGAALTAAANDFGYHEGFTEQLRSFMPPTAPERGSVSAKRTSVSIEPTSAAVSLLSSST